jgi:hypothetical protein
LFASVVPPASEPAPLGTIGTTLSRLLVAFVLSLTVDVFVSAIWVARAE